MAHQKYKYEYESLYGDLLYYQTFTQVLRQFQSIYFH